MLPANTNPHKLRLSIQQWHSLQPEARATWDLLSNEAKAIILGLRKDPGKRAVNLHDISAYDFLQANYHNLLDDIGDPDEILPDPDEDQADPMPQLDEDTSTALLAFLSKQKSTAHPGHLANVLSTSKNKNAKGARFMPKSDASPPRMMRLLSMARSITRCNPIASITRSRHTSQKGWVHSWIEVPMVALLVMTFISSRNLIKLLTSGVLTTTRSPIFPL